MIAGCPAGGGVTNGVGLGVTVGVFAAVGRGDGVAVGSSVDTLAWIVPASRIAHPLAIPIRRINARRLNIG